VREAQAGLVESRIQHEGPLVVGFGLDEARARQRPAVPFAFRSVAADVPCRRVRAARQLVLAKRGYGFDDRAGRRQQLGIIGEVLKCLDEQPVTNGESTCQ
jgi:hypothetical protein